MLRHWPQKKQRGGIKNNEHKGEGRVGKEDGGLVCRFEGGEGILVFLYENFPCELFTAQNMVI